MNFLKKLESLGISNSDSYRDKRIILTNRIAIISFFLASPYLIIFYLFHLKIAALMVIPTNLLCIFVLVCNYYRLHRLASFLVINGITLVILFYSLHLGFNSGAHLIFFPLMAWPFILFSSNQKLLKRISFISLLSSLFLVHVIRILFYKSDILLIDYDAGKIIYFFASITTTLFTSSTIFLFYTAEKKAIQVVEEKNHFLNEKNQELLVAYKDLQDKQRLDKEYESAKKTQEQFLPTHMPAIAGYKIEFFYRGSRGVSGDFFDYRCFAKTAKFFVADVVSKSMAAAFITVHLYSMFRTLVDEKTAPSKLLADINTIFHGGRNQYEKAASFAFDLNTNTHDITYAHAGIGLAVVVKDKKIMELEATGFMTGSDKDGTYDEHVVRLNSGDMLIVASDGLEDVQNDEMDRFGHEALLECIQKYVDLPESEKNSISIKDYVVNTVLNFERKESLPADDIVLIVVEKE